MTDTALTVAQVAERLGVQRHAVLALIKVGQIIASDISLKPARGRPRWRILQSDLDEFISIRTHQPATKRHRRRKKPTNITQYF